MKQESNNPKSGIAGKLNMAGWRKHYVAAMTADEEVWPQREPGSNLGRVFIILLLLHVFLIGAVVLYNVISPKSPPAIATGKPNLARPSATALNTATSVAVPRALAIMSGPSKPPVTTIPAVSPSDLRPIEAAIYEVRSGDNVPGIAAALGVSPADLIKLNNLDNTELYPGRKLTYPRKPAAPLLKAMPVPANTVDSSSSKPESFNAVSPADGNAPPVKLKDSPAVTRADQPPVTKPARKSEPSGGAAKPKSDPPSESSRVAKTGSKSENASKTKAKTEKSSKETAGRRSHTVGPKETLYSIARKYGVKVETLQKANSIKDPTALRDGMRLVIPSKS